MSHFGANPITYSDGLSWISVWSPSYFQGISMGFSIQTIHVSAIRSRLSSVVAQAQRHCGRDGWEPRGSGLGVPGCTGGFMEYILIYLTYKIIINCMYSYVTSVHMLCIHMLCIHIYICNQALGRQENQLRLIIQGGTKSPRNQLFLTYPLVN